VSIDRQWSGREASIFAIMNYRNIIIWIFRGLAALIMLQTLYFKFTAHPQSVHLFTILGMEPWGRIGTGVLEAIASLLILYPRTTGYGALLGLGLMSGAIFFHLTKLGVKFDGDYVLFSYAVIAFISCAVLVAFYRKKLLGQAGPDRSGPQN
jgi:DoxX-like protein